MSFLAEPARMTAHCDAVHFHSRLTVSAPLTAGRPDGFHYVGDTHTGPIDAYTGRHQQGRGRVNYPGPWDERVDSIPVRPSRNR
jgi:hypothetical protein